MNYDQSFRIFLIVGTLLLFPILAYHRLRSQSTREKLDRRQEGWFILLTLRPVGMAAMLSLFAFMIDPGWMAWSSVPLPAWLRWCGAGLWIPGGLLLIWTLRTLGMNLTDTVVTRRDHTLVTVGPYRWIRHPFYVASALLLLASSLLAANWFVLACGVLTFTLLAIRLKREEERLAGRFGDAYRAYRERTGRFLPRADRFTGPWTR
ncbi:MAG: isoprenylcysteine carboxylmethyltransferase family protein [Acidobacteria bacterium]|nr:isoprenylcysteine carboxylmethyltransferase family protein [Acidobacteriota bacterium]